MNDELKIYDAATAALVAGSAVNDALLIKGVFEIGRAHV